MAKSGCYHSSAPYIRPVPAALCASIRDADECACATSGYKPALVRSRCTAEESQDAFSAGSRSYCATCCSTRSRRSRHGKRTPHYAVSRCAFAFFSADIVVGFERDSYNVSEGGSVTICVEIISPDDIGQAQLYLQVGAINNAGQASKSVAP